MLELKNLCGNYIFFNVYRIGTEMTSSEPWYNRFFSAKWEHLYDLQAKKIFSADPSWADDARQEAIVVLVQKLRDPNLASKLQRLPSNQADAYVLTTFKNELRELSRKHFGRCRPKTWVKKLGPFWVKISEMLCVEKLSSIEITERLCAKHNGQNTADSCAEQVRKAIDMLKRKPHCSLMKPSRIEMSDENAPAIDDDPVTKMTEAERHQFLSTLLGPRFPADQDKLAYTGDQIAACWETIGRQLNFSDDERLILLCTYWDNEPVTEVARKIGLPVHKVRRMLKQLLERIHGEFVRNNIDGDSL